MDENKNKVMPIRKCNRCEEPLTGNRSICEKCIAALERIAASFGKADVKAPV